MVINEQFIFPKKLKKKLVFVLKTSFFRLIPYHFNVE